MSQIDWSNRGSRYGCADFKDDGGRWVASFTTFTEGVRTQNHTRSGYLWFDLIKRTEAGGRFQNRNPSYAGVELGFCSYQEFADWATCQPGYMSTDSSGRIYQLDKDILYPGNRMYCPEVCAFVPSSLNSILNVSPSARGELPIGVSLDRSTGKYRARAKNNKKTISLGTFMCPGEAHKAWQMFKADRLREEAAAYLRASGSREDVAEAINARAEVLISDCNSGIETLYI